MLTFIDKQLEKVLAYLYLQDHVSHTYVTNDSALAVSKVIVAGEQLKCQE